MTFVIFFMISVRAILGNVDVFYEDYIEFGGCKKNIIFVQP